MPSAIQSGGDARTDNPLSQFATTTSAQFASVISNETGTGNVVLDTGPALVTPNLGTPSSGNLASCTGLPVSGITPSTSTAIGVGSIELGDASDTTLTRVGAGIFAVEGVNVITTANISDTAFAASWDGVTTVAGSKNSLYDYLTSIKPFADAPAQVVNIAATNAVMSKTGVTVSAGDRFEILCEGAILNNSGGTKIYQIIYNFGSLNVTGTDTGATNPSATARNTRTLRAVVGVKNTSSAWMSAFSVGYGGAALGVSQASASAASQGGSQQSSSNLTGTQNINITIAANTAIPTQTFEVTSWRITKLATNP